MGFSRETLLAEIQEKSLDLEAFQKAREIIRDRVREVRDSSSGLTPITEWSGTDAVLGSLDLSVHAIERTVEELRGMLAKLDNVPVLKLVKDTPDEQ